MSSASARRDSVHSPARKPLLLFCAVVLCAVSASPASRAAPAAPDWVRRSIETASPLQETAPCHALLDEELIEIKQDGTFLHRERAVVRILSLEARDKAIARLYYRTSSHELKSMEAWLLRPDKKVLTYSKRKSVDTTALSTARDLQTENRVRRIDASADVEVGSVFAYEIVWEENSVFSQLRWRFSSTHPVALSRLLIKPSAGWHVTANGFNGAPSDPMRNGDTLCWELRNLPAPRKERHAPHRAVSEPWLGVNILPPAGAKNIRRKDFSSWEKIASHWAPIYEKAATPDNEIRNKATEICLGAQSRTEQLRRLCAYVQQAPYVHILLDAASGGGSIPQAASDVFKRNYGDCKDKATLLSSLLATQGIKSFPVWVSAEEPSRVRPEWPSGSHFDHCILAIVVDDSIDGPAMVAHPKYGRLVIFDPTHPYVPFGNLPESDSGGLGLLIAAQGELISLPAIEPSIHQHTVTGRLHADGSFDGTLTKQLSGPAASAMHGRYIECPLQDFHTAIKTDLQHALAVCEVSQIKLSDDFPRTLFSTEITFAAQGVGKSMQDTLLVLRPTIFSATTYVPIIRGKRTRALVIDPVVLNETMHITLPAGFAVEEVPDNVDLDSPIGTYSSSVRKEADGTLLVVRSLRLKDVTVPADSCDGVRRFVEKLTAAEKTPIVLRRL